MVLERDDLELTLCLFKRRPAFGVPLALVAILSDESGSFSLSLCSRVLSSCTAPRCLGSGAVGRVLSLSLDRAVLVVCLLGVTFPSIFFSSATLGAGALTVIVALDYSYQRCFLPGWKPLTAPSLWNLAMSSSMVMTGGTVLASG